MIPETALALAGDRAHLVSRPHGVAHVFTGSLSRAGGVPSAARPICRARTRRLRVVSPTKRRTSLDPHARNRRVCARCAACLVRARDRARQVTTRQVSRAELCREHAELSKADLAVALHLATSPSEVDAAAWLTLLLFDVAGCNHEFVEHGRTWPPLHDLVHQARGRVHGFPDDPMAAAALANRAAAEAADKARRREVAIERRAARGLTADDRDHARSP